MRTFSSIVRSTNLLFVASVLCLACSAIGDPGGQPDALPHGGTGEFRLLESEESGVRSSLPGHAMVIINIATESGMPVAGHLFYSHADLLDMPPPLPMDHPPKDIFWDAFGPREIHRGTSRESGFGAFDPGPAVLSAAEAWEGAEVFDPWAVVLDDGSTRLYYAAAGGIGVAEAPSVDGTFTRPSSSPVLGPEAALAGSPRRPSVVRGPDGAWWMYYDAGGELRAARSEDGLAFTAMAPLTFTFADAEGEPGRDEGPGVEVGMANPGALSIESGSGRVLVRLYFESHRDGVVEDETARMFYVAGSEDGLNFERHPRPVMRQTDNRFPTPFAVDDIVTLLYGNLTVARGDYQTRAVTAAVSPAGTRFAPLEEM